VSLELETQSSVWGYFVFLISFLPSVDRVFLYHLQVYSREELQMIADLCIKYDCLCISDEVYEWLLYDGHQHVRIG